LLVTDRAVTLSRNTTKHIASLVFAFFISSAVAAPPAQDQDQKTSVDASSSDQAASSSAPAPSTLEPETEVRAVSLKLLVPNILRDQKPIWSFPLKLAHGKHWKPFLGTAIGTAALVVLDPYTEPYFRNRPGFSTYKTGPLRGRNTTLAITLMPVAFYVGGLAGHSKHARNTGLLAAEAIADTQILSFAMKQVAGRLQPSDIPPHGDFRNTWFKYKGTLNNGGSFPSGHTASAFAVATVIAEQYRHKRWVPWVSYTAAALIALTRLPDQAHFGSDIFMGGVLGYTISHFVVMPPR